MSTEITPRSPTFPPPRPEGLGSTLNRNIAALDARRRREASQAGLQDRFAHAMTRFAGSMAFVYVHAAILIGWIAANVGAVPGVPAFDKSFVILATAASVEAIFISTFILISQNNATAAADRRADLDLQINLLAEHEVSRLIALTKAIAHKLDIPEAADEELGELEQDVAPETVLDGLERKRR